MPDFVKNSVEAGSDNFQPKSNGNWENVTKIIAGIGIILGFYFILKSLFGIDALPFLKDLATLKYLPRLGNDAGLGLLFGFGILTSFHCLGMCGGLVVSQTIRNQTVTKPGKIPVWFFPSLLYNSGRVIAYTIVGGIVGGLGQVMSFAGIWKGVVPIFGGLFMVIMGINLLGIFPALRRLNLRMPYFAAKKIQGQNNYGPFYIGLLSGLMPCGPLQIVQLYALSTRSILFGAVSMFVFSLGTVPVMFFFGLLNSIVHKKYIAGILKVSAVFVIILGLVMIGRGLSLSGVMIGVSVNNSSADAGIAGVAQIDGKLQTVVTAIESGSYPPIVVQKGIPVKWVIKADTDSLNGCNNAITIPKYKIDKKLVAGANSVEFIPRETGDIPYTCWMGMIKSKITVVDDIVRRRSISK